MINYMLLGWCSQDPVVVFPLPLSFVALMNLIAQVLFQYLLEYLRNLCFCLLHFYLLRKYGACLFFCLYFFRCFFFANCGDVFFFPHDVVNDVSSHALISICPGACDCVSSSGPCLLMLSPGCDLSFPVCNFNQNWVVLQQLDRCVPFSFRDPIF